MMLGFHAWLICLSFNEDHFCGSNEWILCMTTIWHPVAEWRHGSWKTAPQLTDVHLLSSMINSNDIPVKKINLYVGLLIAPLSFIGNLFCFLLEAPVFHRKNTDFCPSKTIFFVGHAAPLILTAPNAKPAPGATRGIDVGLRRSVHSMWRGAGHEVTLLEWIQVDYPVD